MSSGQPSTAKRATLGMQYGGKRTFTRDECQAAIRKPHSFTLVLSWPIKQEILVTLPLPQESLFFPLLYHVLPMDTGMVGHITCTCTHACTHAHQLLSLLPAVFPLPLTSSPLFLLPFLLCLARSSQQLYSPLNSTQLKRLVHLKVFSIGIYFQQAKRSMSGVWTCGLLFMCFRDYYGATLQSDLCLTVISSDRLSLKQHAQPLSLPQFSLLHS